MAGKVINKMMGFLGLEEDYEDEIEETLENEGDEMSRKEEEGEPLVSSKRQNKVVSIHSSNSAKIKIVKPTTYEEAADICDELKNRKIIIVNTTGLELRIAQRLLDFMGGASYAAGGELQEVEKGIYVLSPSNVEVSSELKNELSGKGLFSWSK